MTATMLATLLAIAINAPAQAPAAPAGRGGPDRCTRDVATAFSQLDRALRALGDDIDRVGNERDRKRLRDELNDAVRASERARNEACEERRPPPPPVVVGPRIMSDAGFAELNANVKREGFDDTKVALIKGVLTNDLCVTADQLKALVGTLDFSNNQLAIAEHALPRVVDAERAYVVGQALTFDGDKKKLTALLPRAGTHPQCRL